MKKIISLFQRNYDGDHLVRNEVVPGAEWVLSGEGRATRKWDGTCCLVRNGKLYKRYESEISKPEPNGFCLEEIKKQKNKKGNDIEKRYGWVPVGDGPEDQWHREALKNGMPKNGTYELVGPKIQGNPEKLDAHYLYRHGIEGFNPDPPRTFDDLREWFKEKDVEGIVWHHLDGRMVKIKKKDFGFKR